jgi:signal transduction histidine kinase
MQPDPKRKPRNIEAKLLARCTHESTLDCSFKSVRWFPWRIDSTAMMTNKTTQMAGLAAHLEDRRNTILNRWRTATEEAPGVTIASTLTRVQFNDHIPGVLDAYNCLLRSWPRQGSKESQSDEKEQISEHGLQRWQQGYQLRDLTREWGHLHMCVMAELDEYSQANPDLVDAVMSAARHAWSKLCWDGISDSTTQYWRLNQAEAAGRLADLEQALATLNELDQTRATAWRETAHDLQGSLSLVSLATSVLHREDLSGPTRHEFFDLMQRGVSSLHQMLYDFMSLARLDAGLEQLNLTSFDAAGLFADFCMSSQPLAKARGLFLEMHGPASMEVQGDQAKVQRILQNLVLNALKYTERGGVTVLWGPVDGTLTERWMFCVQDTGPGLNEDPESAPLAHQIHEATQTAQSAVQSQSDDKTSADIGKAPTLSSLSAFRHSNGMPGEGVGLSIVKRLCELLNASLELETSPNKGSTFRVVLPCLCVDEPE